MESASSVGFWHQFLVFLQTYNIFGVAIGLLIAKKVADFSKSIIEDLITPLLFGPMFKKLKITKLEDLSYKGILYGKVLAITIDFIITALFVFLVIYYAGLTLK